MTFTIKLVLVLLVVMTYGQELSLLATLLIENELSNPHQAHIIE